jgi:hypothetical protein
MGSVAEIIDRIHEVKKRSEERFFIACSSRQVDVQQYGAAIIW